MSDLSHMESRSVGRSPDPAAAKFLRTAAGAVGAVFLLVGIAGFVPGITSNYDQMEFAGHDSRAELLGIFQVSVLHNIVHLLFGAVGLAVAKRATAAAWYLIGGGVIYGVLFVYGLLVGHQDQANFVPVNNADDWLHLVLSLGMLALGLAGYRGLRGPTGAQSPM